MGRVAIVTDSNSGITQTGRRTWNSHYSDAVLY